MHPLEMSPAQLAAIDASQSLGCRDTSVSSDDAAMLAWAKVVDSRTKQVSAAENNHASPVSVVTEIN